MTRLASAPAIGYLILTSQPHLALSVFAYAAVTDVLDGYIARRYGSRTVLGTVLDPMADKTLMTVCVASLAWTGTLPLWLAAVILGRDVALSLAAFWIRYRSLPGPKTWRRYWDFSLPSAEVRPTEVSKWNTFLQLCVVAAGMVVPVLPADLLAAHHLSQAFHALQYTVGVTTVWSGASYLYTPDAVRYVGQGEVKSDQAQK